MKSTRSILRALSITLFSLVILAAINPAVAGNRWGAPSDSGPSLDSRFDTSFALEYSYSCLGGGCHETDTQLVEDHADSFMTHVMVKCNACHGTHTADTVGEEKPNLTGYYPGIGETGYRVGDDRCVACHTPTLEDSGHPNRRYDCVSCHKPHKFSTRQASRR